MTRRERRRAEKKRKERENARMRERAREWAERERREQAERLAEWFAAEDAELERIAEARAERREQERAAATWGAEVRGGRGYWRWDMSPQGVTESGMVFACGEGCESCKGALKATRYGISSPVSSPEKLILTLETSITSPDGTAQASSRPAGPGRSSSSSERRIGTFPDTHF